MRKWQLYVVVGCLAVAAVVIGLRAVPPHTPDQVAKKAIGCYVARNYGCLWGLASDDEKAVISREVFERAMGQVHEDHFQGRLSVDKPLDKTYATGGAVSAPYIVRDESGKRYSILIQATPLEKGAALTDMCLSAVICPYMPVDADDKIVQTGSSRVGNRLEAFRYADRVLAPMGLTGGVSNHKPGEIVLWSDLVAKFDRVERELKSSKPGHSSAAGG